MSTTIQIKVLTFDKDQHTVRIKQVGSAGVVLTPDNPSQSFTLASFGLSVAEFAKLADLNTDDVNKAKPVDEAGATAPAPKARKR